jgi:hypothetical protein
VAKEAAIAAKQESRKTVQQTRTENRHFIARLNKEEMKRRKKTRSLNTSLGSTQPSKRVTSVSDRLSMDET